MVSVKKACLQPDVVQYTVSLDMQVKSAMLDSANDSIAALKAAAAQHSEQAAELAAKLAASEDLVRKREGASKHVQGLR